MQITRLSAAIHDTQILFDVSLHIKPGSIHAVMGPNGSGKSTLAQLIAGNPLYTCTAGTIIVDGVNIIELSPEERSRSGVFLSFQQPPAIPGVTVYTFLKEIAYAVHKELTLDALNALMHEACALLGIDQSFLHRGLNDGFSGGERKKCEMLQLLIIKPRIAILDEIDSGLDIDALAAVARAIAHARAHNPAMSILLITHYQRILEHVKPDHVHILKSGRIVASGAAQLAHELERRGYDAYGNQ